MAESKRKIEFETRKRIFDLVGDEGACGFCKIIPRNGPIYQSEKGDIVCSTCRDPEKGNFQQNKVTKMLKNLLPALPRSCKFKKNGCKITMDIQSIEYHEEDCKYRDIQCVCFPCKKILTASLLLEHLETAHGVFFDMPNYDEKKGSKYIFNRISIEIEESDFELEAFFTTAIEIQKKIIFAVQFGFDLEKSIAKGFVQIIGSKFEAMNYKYTIKIEDPVFGEHFYKNQVKSLDDNYDDVFESEECLILPLKMIRQYIGKDFEFVVEIEDLKPREEDDRESVESSSDEENRESMKPNVEEDMKQK